MLDKQILRPDDFKNNNLSLLLKRGIDIEPRDLILVRDTPSQNAKWTCFFSNLFENPSLLDNNIQIMVVFCISLFITWWVSMNCHGAEGEKRCHYCVLAMSLDWCPCVCSQQDGRVRYYKSAYRIRWLKKETNCSWI